MKPTFITIIFLLFWLAASTQVNEPGQSRFAVMPELAFGAGAGPTSGNIYAGMQTIGSYRFNRYIMAGAGAGIMVEMFELYHSMYLPVFTDARFSLPTGTLTTPFVAASAGYDLGLEDPGGFMYNPYIGLMQQTSERVGWTFAIGYRSRTTSLDGEKFSFFNLRIAVVL